MKAQQKTKKHYFKGCDAKERWISYWYQINEILKTKPKKILEVGIGNSTVSNYLRNKGLEVITVDINKTLKPDILCNVTELNKHFKKNSFDCTLCAEVLEHLPFKYFEKALSELKRVTRNYLVLTLPYAGFSFSILFKFPLIQKGLSLRIPRHLYRGWSEKKFKEHYWEIGRTYSFRKIFKILNKYFEVINHFSPSENLYHYFFILRPKGK